MRNYKDLTIDEKLEYDMNDRKTFESFISVLILGIGITIMDKINIDKYIIKTLGIFGLFFGVYHFIFLYRKYKILKSNGMENNAK